MRRPVFALLTTALLCFALMPARAQTVIPAPNLMNFSGRLTKPDNTPVANGSYMVRFSLWDTASGGTEKWNQTLNATVKNGAFAVLLSGFPSTAFNGDNYLEIKVGADAPLAPRQRLLSVAYAMKANTVPDGSITSGKIADNAINSAKIADGSLTAADFAGGVLTPGGAAGGDLTGFYPNPQIKTDPSLLFKVSGTLMSAAGAGISAAVQQIQAPRQVNDSMWQSFIAPQGGLLTGLDIFVGTTTGQAKTIPVVVYAGEGTTGTELARETSTFSTGFGFQHVDFTAPVLLTGGQKYTFFVGTSSSLKFGYATGNLYTAGRADVGETFDYGFRVYMTSGAGAQISVAANVQVGGKLGVGSVNPGMSFEVSLPSYYNAPALGASNGSSKWAYLNVSTGDHSFIWDSTAAMRFGTETARGTGYTELMRLSPSGNLGIGINNPIAPLHIVGSNPFPHLKVAASANAPFGAFLSLDATATTGGKNYQIFSTGGSAGEGQGKLVFQNYTDNRQILTLDQTGKVGLGIGAPAATLHVLSNMGSGQANDGGILFQHSNQSQGIGFGFNTIYASGTNSDQDLGLQSRGAGSLLLNPAGGNVLASGKVGIGVTPGTNAKLHVRGRAYVEGDSGWGGSPTLSLAVGDTDTGLNWGGDGILQFFTNAGSRMQINPNGYVGIGTASPGARFQITGDSSTTGTALFASPKGSRQSHIHYGGSGDWYIRSAAAAGTIYVQDLGGKVAVGSNGFSNVELSVYANGLDYAVGTEQRMIASGYSTTSDARLKTNVTELPNALDTILGLRGVAFEWKPEAAQYIKGKPNREIGFLAQEVEKVLPQLVREGLNGYKVVDYVNIVPVLVEAVKTQQKQMQAKDKRLTTLETENAQLKATLENVLQRVQALEAASGSNRK